METMNANEITEKVVEILIRHERLEPQLAILALVELKVIASVKAGENGGLLLAFDEWDQLDATRKVLHGMGGSTVEWRGWGRFLLSV